MKQLVKKLKRILEKDKEIIDFIMFGSFVKGKADPTDVDIALLSEASINRIEVKKQIEMSISKKVDLQLINIKDYDKPLWVTLIREGFSVKHNAFLYELYHIKPLVLYKYSLKSLTISKKVMFERALKNFTEIERISNRVVLVPIQKSEEFRELLRQWNIDFDSQEYGLIPLMRKEEM